MWSCALCEATAAGTAVVRSKKRRDLCEWCVAELARTGDDWCPKGKHKATEMTSNRVMCLVCRRTQAKKYDRSERARARAKARRATYDRELWRARQHRYYHDAIEHKRAIQRAYYHRRRDEILERHRRRRAANPEYGRARARAYYWTHRDARRAANHRAVIRRKLAILRGER